eukprot:scaffold254996_cov19-Tisochrysis_lutea.AAC.1
MEAHKAAIDRVVENALARAGVQASQLDAVAVTVGPGLSLCLRLMLGSWGYDLWEEGERRAQITRREDTSRSAECRGSHSGARALH